MDMTIDRAIEILDPYHEEDFAEQSDGLEQVFTACMMGCEALKFYKDYLESNGGKI